MAPKPKIASPTGRNVAEWIGRTPDAMPPPRVRLRIFDRHGGKCHVSGRVIRAGEKWALDHIVPLSAGGLNVESNLAPILSGPHAIKTKAEAKDRAKVRDKRKAHLSIKSEAKVKIKSRNDLAIKPARASKTVPPRQGGIRFVDV